MDTALGVDPAVYPLAGALTLGAPVNGRVAELLSAPGDVLLTHDVAEAAGLQVGDALILADLDIGTPVPATVRGIVADTPGHQGGSLYYTLATAQRLAATTRAGQCGL